MSTVIVVTGASGGIGAALAQRVARDGHAVVPAARRERELKAVAFRLGIPTVDRDHQQFFEIINKLQRSLDVRGCLLLRRACGARQKCVRRKMP